MVINELKVKSTRDNYYIPCIYNFPNNMTRVIIAIHGFGSTKRSETITDLIEKLDKHNIGVIALDLPAHGESSEEGDYLTIDNCIADINSVEEYLNKNYEGVDIGFFASSFGAYLTLLKLNRGEKIYKKIVLRCPAISMAKIFENTLLLENMTLEKFKKQGHVKEGFARRFDVTYSMYEDLLRNDILKNYKSNNNILIIHGTNDEIAPFEDTVKLQQKFREKIKIEMIEDAGHRFQGEGQREKVLEIASNYILNS